METYKSTHSHMSIICHDLERSYKGVYLMAAAVPFFVTALIFIKSAITRQSQSGVVPTDDIKIAVFLCAVSAVLTGCAIRILRFQYHILFDSIKGRFYYKKDNLLGSFKMEGQLQQIKEIYVKKVSVPSDKVSQERRVLYRLGVQVAHQHIVLYLSPMEKEALSMGQSLSDFLGVPFNQDVDELE